MYIYVYISHLLEVSPLFPTHANGRFAQLLRELIARALSREEDVEAVVGDQHVPSDPGAPESEREKPKGVARTLGLGRAPK